jgi:hypothetical protein
VPDAPSPWRLTNGITIERAGGNDFRFFIVDTNSALTLENITLTGGSARGGDGGSARFGGGGGAVAAMPTTKTAPAASRLQ